MVSALYSRDILRLASSLIPDDHLPHCDAKADARAPLCGSRIWVEIALNSDGGIAAMAIRAHACAMGQASAALLREYARGRTAIEIVAGRNALADYLSGDGELPAVWSAFAHFVAARAHVARHGAILLPFDALIKALSANAGHP